MTTTPLPPDQLLAVLLNAPDRDADVVATVLAEATAMAQVADPDTMRLCVLATWCAYQTQLAADLGADGTLSALDHLAAAAVVVAGDALNEQLPRDEIA